MDDETLVAYGGELKALGDGRVGGYLVVFSGPDDPDLTGDFFTKDTDFGGATETDVYYQHGMDRVLGRRKLSESKAKLRKDDIGVWMEAQMALRDDYEKHIHAMAKQRKQGLSSGTAAHLVERERVGKAMWIKSWPLGLDGSITPTPAEPRTSIVPLKTLKLTDPAENGSTVSPGESDDQTDDVLATKGLTEMDVAEIQKLVSEAIKTQRDADAAEAKAKQEREEAIKAAVAEERKKWEAEAKAMRRGSYATGEVSDSADRATYDAVRNTSFFQERVAFWKSSQVNRDVAAAIKGYITYTDNSENSLRDALKAAYKASNDTDMNIGTPADGGYAVPVGHYQGIIAKAGEGRVDTKLGVMDIPGKGTTVNVPTDNGTANVFVSTAETIAFDRDAPVLAQPAMTLVKYTKDIQLSVELLEDEDSKLMAFLDNYVGRALARTYNSLLVAALAAGATPFNLASASAIAATEIPGIVYALADEYADSAKWLMKRSTEGAIRALAGSNWQFVPTPPGSGINSTLWNHPIYHTAFAASPAASAKSMYFGDFSYVGRRDGGLSFLRDPYSKASNGQLVLHYYTRTVFKVLIAEAILMATHPSA